MNEYISFFFTQQKTVISVILSLSQRNKEYSRKSSSFLNLTGHRNIIVLPLSHREAGSTVTNLLPLKANRKQ